MRAILSILLVGLLQGQEWPRGFKPGPSQGKYQDLGVKDGLHHYRTKHYRIDSELALKPSLLQKFTQSAESVAIVLEKIPLPLSAPPKADLPRILICADEESFIKAGGTQGAAGFYNGRSKAVLLLWSQFYPDPNSRSRLGPKADYSILVHELAHLQMHEFLWRTRPWFFEGVAEYFAATHGNAGTFDFTKIEQKVRDRIKKHSDPQIPENRVIKLSTLLNLDWRGWNQLVAKRENYEVMELYSSSLLLTHFYFHGGEKRRTEVLNFLETAKKVRDHREELPRLLLAEQAGVIEAKLVKYWAPKGLKLQFQ
jgi:hypothetical protein